MIYKRLIPVILVKQGIVVQSFNFEKHLPIGRPKFIVDYLSSWDSDEIIVLDISASKMRTNFNTDLINLLSKNTDIPLTIGGGVDSLKTAESYFKNGADKIAINSLFLNGDYSTINSISNEYGAQSLVLSLDFIKSKSGEYFLYDYRSSKCLQLNIIDVIKKINEDIDVGEILVNSVDRDGSKLGFDLDLIKQFNISNQNPVLALGGANKVEHFVEITELENVTGICAANVFLHFEHSTDVFKSYINRNEKILRTNNYFTRKL
jgi:cyclase